MREGSLEAPIRYPLDWQNPDFYDAAKLDDEMRRVFDICHGCRRCFNLCDSFPKLFDLIDESSTGELDSVDSQAFDAVTDACTLCDMCFSTKCPYVPPHEFNIDFPHLMLRHRAIQRKEGELGFVHNQLAQTDRNGTLAGLIAPLANWGTDTKNKLTRPVMEKALGIDREAKIPQFHHQTLVKQAAANPLTINEQAPAFGKKAVIYATCFGNYNNPSLGLAARAVLAHNGVNVMLNYPGCCGMPNLEQGDLTSVAQKAERVAAALMPWIDQGYDIIALIPSCALMLKQEWPLIVQSPDVQRLAKSTYDISQYVIMLEKQFGLAEGLKPLGENVTVHIACHARAQNMGQKGAEMLRLIPDTQVSVIERCSGHGGSWGMMVDHFETALKVGKPVAKQARTLGNGLVLSECPLAGEHILQGIDKLPIVEGQEKPRFTTAHPIEILAKAYGLV